MEIVPADNARTDGMQMDGGSQEELFGGDGRRSVSVPPRRRLPLPVRIALGILGVIVALFALLLIFSSCSRGSIGGGTVAAPTLPTPFEGRVRLRPEGGNGMDFTVLDGESTLILEGTGGDGRAIAGLELVDEEMGSGVYRYDLDQLTVAGVPYAFEEIFLPGGASADGGSAVVAYGDALTGAQAQVIIPAGAVNGDVTGVWGIRYTQGGLPYLFGFVPKDVGFIFTEIMVSINDDGTFTLTSAMEAVGDNADSIEVSEADITVTGTWQQSDAGNISIQPETLRAAADGVPEEETSLSGIVPQIYVGVDTTDVLGENEEESSGGPDDPASDDASDAASAAAGVGADAAQSITEVQPEPSDDAADSAGGSNDVDVSAITDWAFMETARMELGVPQYMDFTFEIGEPYYWKGGDMMVTPITFYQDGYTIAGADCDEDGTPVKNMLPYTGDRY